MPSPKLYSHVTRQQNYPIQYYITIYLLVWQCFFKILINTLIPSLCDDLKSIALAWEWDNCGLKCKQTIPFAWNYLPYILTVLVSYTFYRIMAYLGIKLWTSITRHHIYSHRNKNLCLTQHNLILKCLNGRLGWENLLFQATCTTAVLEKPIFVPGFEDC